jgi:hypothetical protein
MDRNYRRYICAWAGFLRVLLSFSELYNWLDKAKGELLMNLEAILKDKKLTPYGYRQHKFEDGGLCYVKSSIYAEFLRLLSSGLNFEYVLFDGESRRRGIYDPSKATKEFFFKGVFIYVVFEIGNQKSLKTIFTEAIVNFCNVFPAGKFLPGLKNRCTEYQQAKALQSALRYIRH